MLRQVFLYHHKEMIFSHFFGQAYDSATMNLLITKLDTFISNPMDGKVFSKPMFDFQAHYGMFKGVFYIFVTDMADRPKIIAKEIERAAKLFSKHFSDPMEIKNPTTGKEEFTLFIKETHYFLHPKFTLMGPLGAGKTSIASFLGATGTPDKKIMNFAVYYQVKLGEIFFDLWDFVESDDYSPLWNNYVRGSDLIFYVLDGSQNKLTDKKVKFFLNLIRREGKYSNWVVILTHKNSPDFVSGPQLTEKYDLLKGKKIFEVDLADADIKEQLSSIFSDTIGLKRSLPSDFRTKLQQANDFVGTEEFKAAISILQDLIQICEDYQEYSYLEIFKNKINELEEKAKVKQEAEEREARKIKAPKKISFDSFKGTKTLPGQGKLPTLPSFKPQTPNLPSTPQISSLPPKITQSDNLADSNDDKDDILNTIDNSNPFFTGLSGKKPILTGIDSDVSSSKDSIENSVISDISDSNPIFEGLPSLDQNSASEHPLPKVPANFSEPKTPIPQMDPGTPVNEFKIQTHRVNPINVKSIELPPKPTIHEQMEQKPSTKSPSGIKVGETRTKALTLERSPMIKDDFKNVKRDIKKATPTAEVKNNPLESFNNPSAIVHGEKISDELRLQKEIQALGEDLSLPLCEKFIEQLKLRMKKTNLNESDIKKAASLFVIKRKRKTN
ncbi:Rab family GTPase [Candidatus Lokiarchaeum ossiferum]|uniref:Rab family GTPase n=1 Tax=Candidatus Lokiarchaeum ossiferum TaxID=2951803 RepID=UPI00352DCF79